MHPFVQLTRGQAERVQWYRARSALRERDPAVSVVKCVFQRARGFHGLSTRAVLPPRITLPPAGVTPKRNCSRPFLPLSQLYLSSSHTHTLLQHSLTFMNPLSAVQCHCAVPDQTSTSWSSSGVPCQDCEGERRFTPNAGTALFNNDTTTAYYTQASACPAHQGTVPQGTCAANSWNSIQQQP